MIRSMRHGGFDFRDVRALVVEDEDFARTLTSQVLQNFGCASVQVARDGNGAVDLLTGATQSFDLVICDFRMPRMNGLELLKAVRKGLPGVARDIVFAMLTGHADKPIVGLAFQLDVDCFLIKPITAATMNERLVRVLSTARPIKSPLDYHEIDLDPVLSLEFDDDTNPYDVPAGASQRREPGSRTPKPRRVKIRDVPTDSILASPVNTSGGHLLLPAGAKLDQRTLERLMDLAELDSNVGIVHLKD